jgi:hypothetical protein
LVEQSLGLLIQGHRCSLRYVRLEAKSAYTA